METGTDDAAAGHGGEYGDAIKNPQLIDRAQATKMKRDRARPAAGECKADRLRFCLDGGQMPCIIPLRRPVGVLTPSRTRCTSISSSHNRAI